MSYCIRIHDAGVIFEVFARDLPAAKMVHNCMLGSGYASELWQGTTRLA